jgi:citronellol/citronellal dehydrogenase
VVFGGGRWRLYAGLRMPPYDRAVGAQDRTAAGGSEIFVRDILRGRVALVTGGGTGLGRETAIELARCGATVAVAGRREEPLRETVGTIERALGEAGGNEEKAGEGAQWVVGDVRGRAGARAIVGSVVERWGRLDVLVNNAGGQYFTPAEGIAAKGWGAVWRLNVDGMLNMADEAVGQGLGRGGGREADADGGEQAGADDGKLMGGRVINVTLSPHHGMPGMAHSGAARAAVEALTRELAARWAAEGIAVSAVAAGHFDTEAMGKYPDVVRAGMARSVPLQRLGSVREHAWLVALLASPLGAAFSGSTVTLDGARDNWFGPWPPPGLADSAGEVPTEARRAQGGAGTG